jgi:hypothetical protein
MTFFSNYVSIARRAKGSIGEIQFLIVCLETIILKEHGSSTHANPNLAFKIDCSH